MSSHIPLDCVAKTRAKGLARGPHATSTQPLVPSKNKTRKRRLTLMMMTSSHAPNTHQINDVIHIVIIKEEDVSTLRADTIFG